MLGIPPGSPFHAYRRAVGLYDRRGQRWAWLQYDEALRSEYEHSGRQSPDGGAAIGAAIGEDRADRRERRVRCLG